MLHVEEKKLTCCKHTNENIWKIFKTFKPTAQAALTKKMYICRECKTTLYTELVNNNRTIEETEEHLYSTEYKAILQSIKKKLKEKVLQGITWSSFAAYLPLITKLVQFTEATNPFHTTGLSQKALFADFINNDLPFFMSTTTLIMLSFVNKALIKYLTSYHFAQKIGLVKLHEFIEKHEEKIKLISTTSSTVSWLLWNANNTDVVNTCLVCHGTHREPNNNLPNPLTKCIYALFGYLVAKFNHWLPPKVYKV